MKRRILLLVLSTLAVLVMMLITSMVVQPTPVIAQTPAPYYMECTNEQSFDYNTGNSSQNWSGTGLTCGGVITSCADIIGIYATLDNVVYTGGNGECGLDSRGNGMNPIGDVWPPSYGTYTYPEACADDNYSTCSDMGYTRITGFNPENHTADHLVDLGGVVQWCTGSHITWDARVCAIYQSPPPPLPECGQYLTDTHFVSNTWTVSGAFWYYSFYDINSGGSIRKVANFSDGEGTYVVNVYARSATTATLLVSAGGASSPIIISAGSSINIYTGTVNVASLTPEVILQASGGMITVDRICINQYTLNCGVIYDYHFMSPTSWTTDGGAVWFLNEPIYGTPSGVWSMNYGSNIWQPTVITGSGSYTVTLQARQVYNDPNPAEITIFANDNDVGSLFVYGQSWSIVSTTITLDSLAGSFKLYTNHDIIVDWVCLEPANVLSGIGPCGITDADVVNSSLYISDGKFDLGNQFSVPAGGVSVGPINFGYESFNAYMLYHWTSFNPAAWWMSIFGAEVDGAYRVRDAGPALGIVPRLWVTVRQALASPIDGEYNVVFRMKPKYTNAQLMVNGTVAPSGVYQEWSDASVYVGGNFLDLSADCGGLLNGCVPAENRTLDVVEVDDVYIVPGPQFTCGAIAPLTTTVGSCINPNPDFAEGDSDWQFFTGAYVDNVYGWAVLPSGTYIQQGIPTGGSWQQSSQGINVGYSYVIAVGAHLEDANAPGQYTVIVGASQSGQLSFNHQLVDTSSTESTDPFTVTADMLNGSQFDIRIVNEAGGTVMLDYVCIRYNGGPGITPPSGSCLGSWTTSDGNANAVGAEVPENNYVKDVQASMGGAYVLDLAGSTNDEAGSTFVLEYCNATSGICDSIGSIPLDQNFSESFSFVVPAGGYYQGEMRLNNDDAVTYTNLCLRQSQNGPVPNIPPSPPALPIPECGSVNNTASFYFLVPYSVTNEFTGTAYTAAYLSEMIYNYSIYPLVCTNISIANWWYEDFYRFEKGLEVAFMEIYLLLARIISLLEQILAKMDQMPPLCGILEIILWVIRALMEVLFKIIQMIFQGVEMVIKILADAGGISGEARGENAIMYEFNCSGTNNQWMCFVLAGIAELDWKLGDWLNIVSLVVVSMLTVQLVFWVVNQVRDMLQPGSGGDTSG